MANKTSDVSKEEKEFRSNIYKDPNEIVSKNPLCTSCQQPVTELILNGIPQIHPVLKTLFCWKCFHFYGNGEFSVDEEGGEKYCKWCGQGGTLYMCSSCPAGFCKKCIRRNLPRNVLDLVEKDNWKCFCCQIEPLYDLRAQAWAAEKYAKLMKKEQKEADRDYRAEIAEIKADKSYRPEPRKGTRKAKPTAQEKTLHMAFHKYSDFLGMIEAMCDSIKRTCGEMKSQKLSRRATELHTAASVDDIHNKVLSILSNTQTNSQELSEKCEKYLEQWKVSLESAVKQDKEEQDKKKSKESVSDDEPNPKRRKSRKTEEGSGGESEEEVLSKRSKKSAKESEDESEAEASAKKSRKPTKDKESTPLKKRSKFRKSGNDSDESEEESPKSKSKKGREVSKKKSKHRNGNDSETETKSRKNGNTKKPHDSDEEEESTSKRSSRAKITGKSKYTEDSDVSQDD